MPRLFPSKAVYTVCVLQYSRSSGSDTEPKITISRARIKVDDGGDGGGRGISDQMKEKDLIKEKMRSGQLYEGDDDETWPGAERKPESRHSLPFPRPT